MLAHILVLTQRFFPDANRVSPPLPTLPFSPYPSRLGTATLPPFPRKLLWGSTSERVMHDRQSALDKYMQRVVSNQACGSDLVPFLELWRILPE